jgi:hypothetical protein
LRYFSGYFLLMQEPCQPGKGQVRRPPCSAFVERPDPSAYNLIIQE